MPELRFWGKAFVANSEPERQLCRPVQVVLCKVRRSGQRLSRTFCISLHFSGPANTAGERSDTQREGPAPKQAHELEPCSR